MWIFRLSSACGCHNPHPSWVSPGSRAGCKGTERSTPSAGDDQLGSQERLPFLTEKPHGGLTLMGLRFYLCPGPLSIRLRVQA